MLFSAAVTAPSTRHRLASKVPIISSSFSVSRLVKQRTQVSALAVELVVNASSCPCCALNTSRSSIFLPFHFCVSCRNQCGNVVDRARGFAIPCTSPYSMEEASWNGKKPCMTFSIRHFAKRCLHAVP